MAIKSSEFIYNGRRVFRGRRRMTRADGKCKYWKRHVVRVKVVKQKH